ncbi:MAG: fructose-bisphosphate aldolase, partial [Candidatus Poseidoniaceae archaeon]|nr:fructose-bisphosphate aldolase [Candidatus Poseidoniaceae archaeon]
PLGHAETWDKGIDDLEKRCAEAYAQGARFAKWRNVLQIDPANGIPSDLAIDVCVKNESSFIATLMPFSRRLKFFITDFQKMNL